MDVRPRSRRPLHTHDATGTIHVESSARTSFSLGQFFAVWGVRFTPGCLGAYCAGDGDPLWLAIGARVVGGDSRRLVLADGQHIAVVFGTRADFRSALAS